LSEAQFVQSDVRHDTGSAGFRFYQIRFATVHFRHDLLISDTTFCREIPHQLILLPGENFCGLVKVSSRGLVNDRGLEWQQPDYSSAP
jgi:hypothetical protein